MWSCWASSRRRCQKQIRLYCVVVLQIAFMTIALPAAPTSAQTITYTTSAYPVADAMVVEGDRSGPLGITGGLSASNHPDTGNRRTFLQFLMPRLTAPVRSASLRLLGLEEPVGTGTRSVRRPRGKRDQVERIHPAVAQPAQHGRGLLGKHSGIRDADGLLDPSLYMACDPLRTVAGGKRIALRHRSIARRVSGRGQGGSGLLGAGAQPGDHRQAHAEDYLDHHCGQLLPGPLCDLSRKR